MILQKTLSVTVIALAYAGSSFAAVSPDEAKKLGTTLTPFGAEKSGNAAGTIPAYTGGLTTPPAGFKKGSAIRPDPFAADKPLFSIDAKNVDKHADKLTEGTKALIKKYPSYRVDVYPTHRSVAYPAYVTENTVKCATTAKATKGGLAVEGCHAGLPFPIPQSGFEAMWNHLLRYQGASFKYNFKGIYVDTSGKPTLTTAGTYNTEYPYWVPNKDDGGIFYRVTAHYHEPARRAGEAVLVYDPLNYADGGRRAWSYLPGQRRVRVAPSVAFDTPNPSTGGASTYDDVAIFQGSMERFNFKLVGKKEMYVPYNAYKLAYESKADDLVKPNHLNPDFVRWELHRVWVVEATLADGKRHIYSKRVFYLDEDSWVALASDQYDMRGQLYRAGFSFPAPSYDAPAPMAETYSMYDLVSGIYVLNFYFSDSGGVQFTTPKPDRDWTPEAALTSGGVR